MKFFAVLIFSLASFTTYSQNLNLCMETYGGVNMTRIRTSNIYNGSSAGYVHRYNVHPQLGGQAGCLLSIGNTRFSPLVGLQFSRNTSYATLRYSAGYTFSTNTIRDIYYLKWDIIHTDFLLLMQIGLGADKNIRLFSGIALSSNLVNLSTQRYWLSTFSPYQPPQYEHVSEKVEVSSLNTIICSGISLPVLETKWSIQAIWRYCPQRMNPNYGFKETGVQISLAYDLSEKVFRRQVSTTTPEN